MYAISVRLRILIQLITLMVSTGLVQADEAIPYPGDASDPLPRRIALVIAVEHYTGSGSGRVQLDDALGASADARQIADLLPKMGFNKNDITILGADPTNLKIDLNQIEEAIATFVEKGKDIKRITGRGSVMLFYFAGHGITDNEGNYLLPSTFFANDIDDLGHLGISLENDVIKKMANAEPELKIIITDACRSKLSMNLSHGSNENDMVYGGIWRAKPDPMGGYAKNHTYILYASLPDNKAFGGATGGRFTKEFIKSVNDHLKRVEQGRKDRNSLVDVFEDVKTDMSFTFSNKEQQPEIDHTQAYLFKPFPTKEDFDLEKKTYDGLMEEVVPLPAQALRKRRICMFMTMLNEFTRYSYFSPNIIKEIEGYKEMDSGERAQLQPAEMCAMYDEGSTAFGASSRTPRLVVGSPTAPAASDGDCFNGRGTACPSIAVEPRADQ